MIKNEPAKTGCSTQNRCNEMMDSFLILDKHERIPLKVTLHLLGCKKCRTQVRYLTKAEKLASAPLKTAVPVTSTEINGIIKKANPIWTAKKSKVKPVSMKKWISYGILMFLLMLSYTFYAAKISGEAANTFFYIVFGIIITAYCAIFIAANLDFFIKRIEKSQLASKFYTSDF